MIGLLGGTFDPIHYGHLDLARAARQALELPEVWLVPSRLPPHRRPPVASPAHRFAMVALALSDQDGLLVSDLEMDTPGPSYTVETLDRLEARGLSGADVCFITGADAFCDIRSWRAFPELLDRCHFAVVSRPGTPVGTLREAMPDLAARMTDAPATPNRGPAIHLVEAATAPVSSTAIRRALEEGRSVNGLLPAAVAAHIERHRLYVPITAGMPDRDRAPRSHEPA
jgi:nicotinate-nucleotide adenylyltransferase